MPLRIILKTRNDPIFLADWHAHHAAIVGAENLIIADNMSDDPQVIALLEDLAQVSPVFRFEGFHNDLHRRERFAPLYNAIEAGCDWSILLDTDERLIWVEEHSWFADTRLVERLRALTPGTALQPGLLIENQPGSRSRFVFPGAASKLAPVLHWGKPAVASGRRPSKGAPCHNIQYPAADLLGAPPPQLVQLHLCNLVPEQRLRANREKLAARGVCAPDTSYDEIARIDLKGETRSVVRRCVHQTRRLLGGEASQQGATMSLQPDDRLVFSDPEAAACFDLVQQEGVARLREAMKLPT